MYSLNEVVLEKGSVPPLGAVNFKLVYSLVPSESMDGFLQLSLKSWQQNNVLFQNCLLSTCWKSQRPRLCCFILTRLPYLITTF